MKSLAFIFVLVFAQGVVFGAGAPTPKTLKDFLHQYFHSDSYQVLKEKINLGTTKLMVAVRCADSTKRIFNKGVAVELEGENVVPLLFFEKNKILNGNRKALVDVTASHYNYFGWRLYYSVLSKPSKYVSVTYFFDGGGSMADDLTLKWDSNARVFREHEFNNE